MKLTALVFLATLTLLPSARSQCDSTAVDRSLGTQVIDLRAKEWRTTKVVDTGLGLVQYLGDDRFPAGLSGMLGERLAAVLARRKTNRVTIKTADIRLSLPDARIDSLQAAVVVATDPSAGLIAAPVIGLLSSFSKDKMASAVFCVSVDGDDYLGNHAHRFRFGAEGELKDAIEAALQLLEKNLASGNTSSSPACAPGWEGGQPPTQ